MESPEEKLLRAVFGEAKEEPEILCADCQKPVEEPIYLNGQPYYPACLPYGREE